MKLWITQDMDGSFWLHLKDGKGGACIRLETKPGICARMLNRAKVGQEPVDSLDKAWKARGKE